MSLTPLVTTGSATSFKSPDAVIEVSSSGSASSSGNTFTTAIPKVLYTAPSDCVSTKIYFNKSIKESNISYMESSTNTNYFYALQILNGTTSREIIRGGDNNTLSFNYMQGNISFAGSPLMVENDVFVIQGTLTNGNQYISGKNFTLGPGESLQLHTFHNSNNKGYSFNFQAWVYNS